MIKDWLDPLLRNTRGMTKMKAVSWFFNDACNTLNLSSLTCQELSSF